MRILYFLLFAITSLSVNAQNFQRLFRADNVVSLEVIDAITDGSDNTIVLSRYTIDDQSGINIAKHDEKGNIDWSKDYAIDGKQIQRFGDLQWDADSLLVAFYSGANDAYEANVIKLDNEGELLWNLAYDQAVSFEQNVARPLELATVDDGTTFLCTSHKGETESLNLIAVDAEESINAQIYASGIDDASVGLSFNNIVSNPDSSVIYASGLILAEDTNLFLLAYNADGLLSSNQYNLQEYGQAQVFKHLVAADSTHYLVGTATEPFDKGFVVKLDKLGNVEWAKTVDVNDSNSTYLTDVTFSPDGQIILAGSYFSQFLSTPILLSLSNDGNLNWQRQYDKGVKLFKDENISPAYLGIFDQGNLTNTTDGYLYAVTARDISGEDLPNNKWLIKTDSEGKTLALDSVTMQCDNDVSLLVDDILVQKSSLPIQTSELAFDWKVSALTSDTVVISTAPILSVDAPSLCPDEPINVTLDAFEESAASYEWSTGDTTTSIVVTDDSQYTVTLTYTDEICFQLCDTAAVFVYPDLQAAISILNKDAWCEDGSFDLQAIAQGGDGNYTYAWANGETTSRITLNDREEIENAGSKNYQVTVTGGCDQVANLSITVSPSDFTGGGGVIVAECMPAGGYLLMLQAGDIDLSQVVWSNGVTGQTTIEVQDDGEYSVTYVDACDNTVQTSINIADQFGRIEISKTSDPCDVGNVTLQAVYSSDILANTIMWSSGQAATRIDVTEVGTYTVTGADACGNEVTASVAVDSTDFSMDLSVSLSVDCGEAFTTVNANATGNLGSEAYSWSTGANTPSITLSEPETVMVTVTDVCNRVVVDSIVVTQGNFYPCECVSWPNFMSFVRDVDERDDTFGPVNWCGDEVTDYSLHIYNAYGNLLFESNSFDKTWNGRKDDDEMPSGVYMYYSTYTVNGEKVEKKGDITLVR